MREEITVFGVITIIVLIITGVYMWTSSGFEKSLNKEFKNMSANYTNFSV